MVLRVTLVVTLIATDPVANVTPAINLVIWREIAPLTVLWVTLVTTVFAKDSVANATIVNNMVI